MADKELHESCLWCSIDRALDAVDAVREANDTVDRLDAAQDEANDKWHPTYRAKEEALKGLRNREVSLYETLDRIHTAVRSEREAWDTYSDTGAAYHRARKDKAAALNELFDKVDHLRAHAKAARVHAKAEQDNNQETVADAKPSEPLQSLLSTASKPGRTMVHNLRRLKASDEDIAVGLAILSMLEELGVDSTPIMRDTIADAAGVKPAKVTSSAKKLVEMDWITRETGQAFPVGKSGQKDKDDDFRRRHTVYGYGPRLNKILGR